MIRICHFITEIEELSSQKSDVVFVKVDVDDNEEAAAVRLFFLQNVFLAKYAKYILPFQQYNISAMPTFIFIKNKEKVDDMMGANYEKLKEMVEKHA